VMRRLTCEGGLSRLGGRRWLSVLIHHVVDGDPTGSIDGDSYWIRTPATRDRVSVIVVIGGMNSCIGRTICRRCRRRTHNHPSVN
jgi:hypothetical protein